MSYGIDTQTDPTQDPNALDKAVTLKTLAKHKKAGEKFVVVALYDAPMAAMAQKCGVEVVLVQDMAHELAEHWHYRMGIDVPVIGDWIGRRFILPRFYGRNTEAVLDEMREGLEARVDETPEPEDPARAA